MQLRPRARRVQALALASLAGACASNPPPPKLAPEPNAPPPVIEVDAASGELTRRLRLEEDPATGVLVIAGTDGEPVMVQGNEPCEVEADCSITNWMGCCPKNRCEQYHPVNAVMHQQRTAECDPNRCPEEPPQQDVKCELHTGTYASTCLNGSCGIRVAEQGMVTDPLR